MFADGVDGGKGNYAKYILILVTICNLLNLWHRYLPFSLAAVSTPECHEVCSGVPYIPLCETCPENSLEQLCNSCKTCRSDNLSWEKNINDGACVSSSEYGILAGFGFTLIFATCGLFAGRLADRLERRLLLALAVLAWSAGTLLQGACRSFRCLLLARLVVGAAQAFNAPCCYIFVAQYFEERRRATANGVYSAGNFLGAALGSLSIALASAVGWRDTCALAGTVGVLVAAVVFLTARDRPAGPARPPGAPPPPPVGPHRFPSLRATLNTITSSWPSVLLILATSCRMVATFTASAFLPTYFMRAFPHAMTSFSVLNTGAVAVGGALSSVLGGRLADKLSKRRVGHLALVPALGTLLALAPITALFAAAEFPRAMAALAGTYLLAEGWMGPGMAVLQREVPRHMHGVAVSLLLFANTLIGSLGPHLLALADPGTARGLARAMYAVVLASHLLSGAAFLYLARVLDRREAKRRLSRGPSADLEGLGGGGGGGDGPYAAAARLAAEKALDLKTRQRYRQYRAAVHGGNDDEESEAEAFLPPPAVENGAPAPAGGAMRRANYGALGDAGGLGARQQTKGGGGEDEATRIISDPSPPLQNSSRHQEEEWMKL